MAIIAIVGRPNVGKSTLFNKISKSGRAIVDDLPGVTRDRNYCRAVWDEKAFTIVDTGGFISKNDSIFDQGTREQIFHALAEADMLLFVGDGKTGLHPEDASLLEILRRTSKPLFFSVNKIDGPEQMKLVADFYTLGVQEVYPISAAHGFGVSELLSEMVRLIAESSDPQDNEETDVSQIRVSILGRPNVGKSTLVNRILGAPRVIVSPIPGTTRDAVDTHLEREDQKYLLIDTAGIRKKGKTRERLEKISIIKALQSIDKSHVCVLLIDASEGTADQDLHIAGYVRERYRACIIGVNKWDGFDSNPKRRKNFLEDLRYRFRFMPFAPVLTLSALTGRGVQKLLPAIREVFAQYNTRISTGILNRTLQKAVDAHEPPLVRGRRFKFFYATQAATRPPMFVLFCNYPNDIHFSYERFLSNKFRESLGLDKTPLRFVFRGRRKTDG
ncbi:MAG TPA: ribosome biogenesis GTPase Der [Syntrophobacteraceae bacterium]|nr:ribosome biogenesis GTPase Der [Syntrophobacteraceae bacterium]